MQTLLCTRNYFSFRVTLSHERRRLVIVVVVVCSIGEYCIVGLLDDSRAGKRDAEQMRAFCSFACHRKSTM